MIKRLMALAWLLSGAAYAETASPSQDKDPEVQPSLEERLPFKTLLERSVAYVKRPAIIEWRKKSLYLQAEVGQAIEYNNFSNTLYGLNLRFPGESMVFKTAFLQAHVGETEASRQVAKTPFQQTGRPSRFEWQNGLEIPVIEGIGQQLFTWMQPAQFVLSGVLQLNTYIYQGLDSDAKATFTRLVATKLSTKEARQLSERAPAAMRVQKSLHSVSAGLQWDHYYAAGIAWTARFLYERPAGGESAGLSGWYSFSLGVGYGL